MKHFKKTKKLATAIAITLSTATIAMTTMAMAEEYSTTAAEQTALSVTIYNSNVALIKDRRDIDLPTGVNTLAFKDVSAKIQPETAILGGNLTLLEQNFEYDLLTPQALLDKFVGQTITVESRDADDNLISETATVLANNSGAIVKIGDKIRANQSLDTMVFNDVPRDLRDRPTLTMVVDNPTDRPVKGSDAADSTKAAKQAQTVELTYLSDGLSWKADYVAALRDDKMLDLKGWVTLTNNSGTTYRDANLQLVAGELNRVQAKSYRVMEQESRFATLAAAPVENMTEETLFEYHLYSLNRPTTIKNKQQKQVSLLEAKGVPYQKHLEVTTKNYAGWQVWDKSVEYRDLTTAVTLVIDNKKADNLGMPLPAGIVRTYQKDRRDNMQFIGEDRIKHTPENESLTLKLGEAFDVTAKIKQSAFQQTRQDKKNAVSRVRQRLVTASYEVVFKNAKDSDVTVTFLESFYGDWKVTEQSLRSTKRNSQLNRWRVNIPAKGETVLTYTVEMRF